MAPSPSADESMGSEAEGQPALADVSNISQRAVMRLACQACRQRKIACDRKTPCSHCCRAGLACDYEPRKRSTVKTQRIHITSQYEKKIDDIQEQMTQMVQLLGRLTASNASTPDRSRASSMHQTQSAASSDAAGTPSLFSADPTDTSSQTQFEGESSLAAHTAFANSLIERAVSTTPLQRYSAEMATTMETLRHLVEAKKHESSSHETTYRRAKPDPNPVLSLEQNPMPPIDSVMAALQLMKTNPQFDSVGFFMFLKAEDFMGFIRKVYFPGGGFSLADFIIANGGLIDVFLRSIFLEEDDSKRTALQHHMESCEANLETALSRLPIHMPNTIDYCLALLFGVNHCIKSSKSSAAWTLVTTALHMCISAGYHRAPSKNDPTSIQAQKSWIFWSLYSVEKGLSLRLGRPSSVSDYDITLPLPELDTDDCKPHYSCTIRWIKLSSIQGRVYMRLYSPAALSEPHEARVAWAQSLAAETTSLLTSIANDQVNDQPHTNSQWKSTKGQQVQLVFYSEEIQCLSTLSLILKTLPPDEGSPSTNFATECINTARAGLEKHQEFIETVGVEKGHYIDIYVNWTILYNPFVPFIVVFCHVIETGDPQDLARLDAFVKSLETARQFSEATAKMYHQSKVLYDAAKQYTELTASKGIEQQDTSLEEFDAYIQGLGMVPLGLMGNPGNELLFQNNDAEMARLPLSPGFVSNW